MNFSKVAEDGVNCNEELVKGGQIAMKVCRIDISQRPVLEQNFVFFSSQLSMESTHLSSGEGGDQFVPLVVLELDKQCIHPLAMNTHYVTARVTLINEVWNSVGRLKHND